MKGHGPEVRASETKMTRRRSAADYAPAVPEPAPESTEEGFLKLFASVSDPQTQDNHPRHLALTKNVLYQNEHGWKLAELPMVNDFLLLLRDKLYDGAMQFAEHLFCAIVLCGRPFVRQKTNEEILNPALLTQLIPTLAQLMSLEIIEIQVAAADALRQFATGACLARPSKGRGNHADSAADDLRLPTRVFSQNLIEETNTVDLIIGVFHDLFPDDDPLDEQPILEVVPPTNEAKTDDDTAISTTRVELNCEDRPLSPSPNGEDATTPDTSATPPPERELQEDQEQELRQEQGREQEQEQQQQQQHEREQEQTLQEEQASVPVPEAMNNETNQQEAFRDARLERMVFPLIDLVHELSSNQRCAEVLVVTGALHYIVFVLNNISSCQDELLPLCLTTLWNVLELSEEKLKSITTCESRRELLVQFRLRNAAFFLSTEFTLQSLLKVLELLLVRGYRKQDKEMRNECVMILLLLARRQRSLALFHTTGVTSCLLAYATGSESASKRQPAGPGGRSDAGASGSILANSSNYATNGDEDLEFKLTLWLLLSTLASGHENNLRTFIQFRFVEILLRYATHDVAKQSDTTLSKSKVKQTSATPMYSSSQLNTLQTTALSVLNNIAPFLLDHFYEVGGHASLLAYVQSGIASVENLTSAWLLMLQIAPPVVDFQDELARHDAVEAALAAFNTPPSRHTFVMRRHAILVCSQLCRHHDANCRRFFDENGVSSILKHLEFDAAHSVMEENILVGIVEAVRSCIVGHSASELAFLHGDGVSRLLSILELAGKAIKNQAMAALAEICVNPAAIPSYSTWRSDRKETNNMTANQLLLRIYAKEEAAEERNNQLVVANGPTGCDTGEGTTVISASNVRSSAFRSIVNCNSFLVVYPTGECSNMNATTHPDNENDRKDTMPLLSDRPLSPPFARLKDALQAAQTLATSPSRKRSSVLELNDDDYHPQLKLKAKIHSVLANLSFTCEDSESLTAKELVMLEIAKEYPTFQIGEMWQNIELMLHAEGVRPIYADALHIRMQIEHAFNTAVCTKHAQKEILLRDQDGDDIRERAFFASILQQKQQDEQAEVFHRANRRQNSTMKLHLDAKKTRLEFMKKQDPTAFAVYEREEKCQIEDPPPVFEEELSSIAHKERELRGRLSTI